jgi:protein-tyrosine-phosphatase
MAAGLMERRAGGRIVVASAGITPAEEINPTVVEAMREVGIDLSDRRPAGIDANVAASATVIVTIGCRESCPVYPNVRYVDWQVPDPSDRPIDDVRAIRDDIEVRIQSLVDELLMD